MTKTIPRIALAFIYRDDQSTIEGMLNSVLPFVDEVVAVDTGSEDATRTIVKKMLRAWKQAQPGARFEIVDHVWTDDFSAARQAGWDKVTADWAIWVDADDELDGAQNLRQLVAEAPDNIHAFVLDYDYAQTPDGANVCWLRRERLIRSPAKWKWASPVHEVLIPQETSNFAYSPTPVYRHRKQPKPNEGDRNLRIIDKHFAESLAAGVTPDPRMAAYRGTELASRGRHEEALEAYDYYFELSGWGEEKHQSYHRKADSLRALGRWDESMECDAYAMMHAEEHGVPEWADHCFGIGESLIGKMQHASAIKWFERGVAIGMPTTNLILNPRDYDWAPNANLASCYLQTGDYTKGMEHAKAAWAIMPTPELRGLLLTMMRSDRKKQAADAAVGLLENLIRYDENAKALEVCKNLPYAVLDDPRVQQMRHHLYVSLRHVRGKDRYGKLYETNREVRNPDEMVEDASMRLVRVTELAQGLRDQLGLPIADLSPFVGEAGDGPEETRAKLLAGVQAMALPLDVDKSPLRLLDAGCNDGWVSAHIERVLHLAVADGIDLNHEAIIAAQARAGEFELEGRYEEGFVEDAPDIFGEGEFDAVSMFEVFEHLVDPHAVLDRLEKVLTPEGRVYISTPIGAYEAGCIDNWSENWDKQHLRAVTPSEFARFALQRGFLHTMAMGSDGTQVVSYKPQQKKGRIVFHAGHSVEPWNALDINERGLGGSETAIVQMADKLASRGWFVEVYAGVSGVGPIGQVLYRMPYEYDPEEHCDVFVSVRNPVIADWAPNADVTVLWCHDAHMGGQLRDRQQAFDSILALSDDHAAALKEFEGVENCDRTRNGIDLKRWPRGDRPFEDRDPTVIYSSSPDRGLEKLLDLWPQIKEQVPDAALKVFYGFDVFDKMHAANPPMQDWKKRLVARMEELDGVEFHGRVDQQRLAHEQESARVWAYPYPYENHTETSCITAMEAMAAGLYCVATESGALPETLTGGGIVMKQLSTGDFPDAGFVAAVIAGLSDPGEWEEANANARARAASLSWDAVADEWDDRFSSILSTV